MHTNPKSTERMKSGCAVGRDLHELENYYNKVDVSTTSKGHLPARSSRPLNVSLHLSFATFGQLRSFTLTLIQPRNAWYPLYTIWVLQPSIIEDRVCNDGQCAQRSIGKKRTHGKLNDPFPSPNSTAMGNYNLCNNTIQSRIRSSFK